MFGYGNFESENKSKFNAGVNNCTLKSFELVTVESDNYKGKALELVFDVNGETLQVRKFPVDRQQLSKLIAANPTWYTKYVNKEKVLMTLDDLYEREVTKLSSWIRHVVSAYVGMEVYNTSLSAWISTVNSEITFDMFCTFNKGLLPPHFKSIPAKIVLGYYKNKVYLEVPKNTKDCGNFFATDLSPDRVLVSPDGTMFKSVKFGDNLPQEPKAVSEVENDEPNF